MDIEFDPAKSKRNIAERGLPFELAADFDFETALIWQDDRFAYPEDRWVAIGFLGERLHVLCFCETERGIRVISFRKANAREVRRYDKAQTSRSPD